MNLDLKILLVLSLCTTTKAFAQDFWNNLDFALFEPGTKEYNINQIVSQDSFFKPIEDQAGKTKPSNVYWLRADFSAPPPIEINDSIWYFRFRTVDQGDLYFLENDTITKMPVGKFDQNSKSVFQGPFSEVTLRKNSLIKNRYLYLKVRELASFENPSTWQFDYVCIYEYSNTEVQKHRIPLFSFLGVCAIIFILTTAFFLYFKQSQYFYYSLYILFISTYLSAEPLGLNKFLFGENSIASLWFSQTIKILFNVVYIWFCMAFIDVKNNYNAIYKLLLGVICSEFFLIGLNTFFLFNQYHLLNIYLIHFHHIFMIIAVAVYSIGYIIVNRVDNLSYFIIAAASIYFLSFVAQYYLPISGPSGQIFKDNNYYLIIGFALEIVIFTFGFAYKILLDYNEKLRFERESIANKTIALRAQINPHFIFNSLGSIQHLISTNNKASALKYLSKFSRFTRNVLEYSIEPDILLSEEIKMLKDYLELESLRFNGSFNYSINLDPDINPDAIEVPLLVIQPFVENAIIHGFLHKKEGAKALGINFLKEDNYLICEIDDNGVGRNFHQENNSIGKGRKKSRGLKVTAERLDMFNQLTEESSNIRIIDKKSEDGQSLGTKVIIKILIR